MAARTPMADRYAQIYPAPPLCGEAPEPLWQGHTFAPHTAPLFPLPQGPFSTGQDDGWLLLACATPSQAYYPNPGMGFIGYAWEENGPSLAARTGAETLRQHVQHLLALPFMDVLYIRCDWRDVQTAPGKLHLAPIWQVALEAAEQHGKRVAFRIQASSPGIQPGRLSMPEFLQEKIPFTTIHRARPGGGTETYREPLYTSGAFFEAAVELNELLAQRFDGDERLEFVDLMMFGFWGEGHTGGYANGEDMAVCQQTFLRLAEAQHRIWRRTPLAVNVQTDISRAGNSALREYCMRRGMYLRTDSVMINEPAANEQMAGRSPACAGIVEDGYYRHFDVKDPRFTADATGVNVIENTMLHALDLAASYVALWTEGENLRAYHEGYPAGFNALMARMGYRVRPAWVYQRKRQGACEVVVALHNDGVAGVPGHLALALHNEAGQLVAEGCLDAGHPYAGRMRQCAFLLPKGLEGGRLELRASLLDKKGRRPVRFACGQNHTPAGGFAFELQPAHSRHWRKDV